MVVFLLHSLHIAIYYLCEHRQTTTLALATVVATLLCMCGIFLRIGDHGGAFTCTCGLVLDMAAVRYNVSRRGPDHYQELDLQLPLYTKDAKEPQEATGTNVTMAGAVLRIQGSTDQPHVDAAGNFLLWNGEVFGRGGPYHCSEDVGTREGDGKVEGEGDTPVVAALLAAACDGIGAGASIEAASEAVAQTMASIHGPFAFAYLHRASGRVFYGRDPFGRRSLLRWVRADGRAALLCSVNLQLVQSHTEALAEVGAELRSEEVPISGVFALPVEGEPAGPQVLAPYPPWRLRLPRSTDVTETESESVCVDARKSSAAAAAAFKDTLTAAIQCRVNSLSKTLQQDQAPVARVGVLFSGGIDSVLLAALLHFTLPADEPVDLINVTFFGAATASGVTDTTPSPDRLAAISAYVELKELFPRRPWRMLHVDVTTEERLACEPRIMEMIYPSDTHMDLNIGSAFWFAARCRGYVRDYSAEDAAEALQRSVGGRPLLRIGGEGVASGKGHGQSTGKASKHRKVDKGKGCSKDGCELPTLKKGCDRDLCSQCCYRSEDPSGCSVHCRGRSNAKAAAKKPAVKKEVEKEPEPTPQPGLKPVEKPESVFADLECKRVQVVSTARVLLVGIGADEQMAGYGRHRTTFLRGGVEALTAELNVDLERLHSRNLGRDDRCMTDHGREAWFPYLDEGVVGLLHSLTLREIADLHAPAGQGDKQVLRLAAKSIGLRSSADLVKRAVQFGTRIAKHTAIREFGSNRKGSGRSKVHTAETEE